jgi:predicted anti-sigma-YlaC factor YlaD
MDGETDHESAHLPRFCRETRGQLPALLAGELSGWAARVVHRHLRRCTDCATERDRQQHVTTGLSQLKGQSPVPPPELLAGLLEQARRPGLRGRAAVPARGAVSGARPELSLAFLTVGALATTGVGWAAWKTGRAATRRIRHR